LEEKCFSALELDINAHFQKGVLIKNSLIEAEVKGDLQIKGDPAHSILKGDLDVSPNGKLFFRETPFNINIARARFNNPTENNPQLYATATSRVRDWDVNILYQGNLDKFEMKLSSSPPLPEKSIISLLALGLTDDSLEKNKSSDQLALQGYQAGSVILSQNPLIQDFKRKTGVSFGLKPNVDDTKNTVMPRFVAEKQWTPKLSTSVGRTFGDKSSRDVSVEYRFNRNVSILGSFEQRDYDQLSVSTTSTTSTTSTSTTNTQTTTDILGINLQYQKEFK
jgi:translocation and assembly module TamB